MVSRTHRCVPRQKERHMIQIHDLTYGVEIETVGQCESA
jgi:hypothetical protein